MSAQVAGLKELLSSGDAAIEAYLEPRHVLDVLEDFAPAKPPLDKVGFGIFCACLPLSEDQECSALPYRTYCRKRHQGDTKILKCMEVYTAGI